MSGAWSLLVLIGTVALCVTLIILCAESDNDRERARTCRERGVNVRDWRDTWCCLECWAEDGQDGPCGDCPGLRSHGEGRHG